MDGRPERDEAGFARLADRHRPELRMHCFRLTRTYDESEDLVQETLLRAWLGWSEFQHRSSFRTWLYRIATNACLSELAQRARRPRTAAWPEDGFGQQDAEPDTTLAARESTERTWLLLIRLLPARQRMVLTLRDGLGWSAKETATALETSVAAVNSRLQRARATLRERGGRWDADAEPKANSRERELLRCYVAFLERGDPDSLAQLRRAELRHDLRSAGDEPSIAPFADDQRGQPGDHESAERPPQPDQP